MRRCACVPQVPVRAVLAQCPPPGPEHAGTVAATNNRSPRVSPRSVSGGGGACSPARFVHAPTPPLGAPDPGSAWQERSFWVIAAARIKLPSSIPGDRQVQRECGAVRVLPLAARALSIACWCWAHSCIATQYKPHQRNGFGNGHDGAAGAGVYARGGGDANARLYAVSRAPLLSCIHVAHPHTPRQLVQPLG